MSNTLPSVFDYNTKPTDTFDLLYRGLALPLVKKPKGYFQTSNSRDVIKADIFMLLTTRKGERVMLPDYGSSVPKLLFEPNDSVTRSLLNQVILSDLEKWEPRVKVTSIDISFSDDGHELNVHVGYTIKTLREQDSLVIVYGSRSQVTA